MCLTVRHCFVKHEKRRRYDFVVLYAKNPRLSGSSDWIDLSFVEREQTPRQLIEVGIRLHLADLSLSNTIQRLYIFVSNGVARRSTIGFTSAIYSRQRMMKPNHVALDETVIQLDEHRYWLYTAVNPETNKVPNIRLYSTTTTALTEWFLQELTEKHDLDDAVFLVDGAKHLQTALRRSGLRFRYKNMEIGTLFNISVIM